MGQVTSWVNEWKNYSNYFNEVGGGGDKFPRTGSLPTFWPLMISMRTVAVLVVVSLGC